MAAPSGATPKSSVIYELAGHLCCRSVKRRGEKKVFYLWKKDLWMASDMEPSPFRNKRANGSLLFIYFSGRYSCVWVNIWRDAMLWETSCAAAGFHWTCDMPTPNKKWERINKLWPSAGRISSTAGLSLSLSAGPLLTPSLSEWESKSSANQKDEKGQPSEKKYP